MNKYRKLGLLLILPVFVSLAAVHVYAQGAQPDLSGFPGTDDFTIQRVYNIIVGIACWLSGISMAIIVIFIIFYGLMFLNSRGDPEKYTQSKKSFLWGIIGILVILGTYAIISTVGYFINPNDPQFIGFTLNCTQYFGL